MAEKHPPKGVSRRRFLGQIGAGAAATAVTTTGAGTVPVYAQSGGQARARISLHINGHTRELEVEARETLVSVLRNRLDLTGAKLGCNAGECGACTVLLDGKTAYACMLLAIDVQGRKITTIEGLANGDNLHPVQEAFIEEDAYQCGFCTPGHIMAVTGLLKRNPNPSMNEVKAGVSGNLCRCAAYPHIFAAALSAAKKTGGK